MPLEPRPLVHVHDVDARWRQRTQAEQEPIDTTWEVHDAPRRRRWGYEEAVITDTQPGDTLDMIVVRWLLRLCQRKPFVAGWVFCMLTGLVVFMTLNIFLGVQFTQNKEASLLLFTPHEARQRVQAAPPQGRILRLPSMDNK